MHFFRNCNSLPRGYCRCGPCPVSLGGDNRDRTDDPLLAKQVLSQLSYTPVAFPFVKVQSSLSTLRLSEKSALCSANIIFALQTMSCFLRNGYFFGLRCSALLRTSKIKQRKNLGLMADCHPDLGMLEQSISFVQVSIERR